LVVRRRILFVWRENFNKEDRSLTKIREGLMPHIPVRPPFGAAARSKSAILPICRTLEGLQTLAGFQDQCIRPLCHLSGAALVV